jgi:hypothetical protein
MKNKPPPRRAGEQPVRGSAHGRYWRRVLEGYAYSLIQTLIAPLLIFLIFATGAWVQSYQDWTWKSILPLWALFSSASQG